MTKERSNRHSRKLIKVASTKANSAQLDLLSFISNESIPVTGVNKVRRISSAKSPKVVSKSRSNILPISVDRSKTFSNFISGSSNSRALDCLKQVSLGNYEDYPTLYINALSGLGKSHLLYACANHLFSLANLQVHYFHGKEFIYNFNQKNFNLENKSVFFIDDMDEVTADASVQDEFCRKFDFLKRNKIQIIMAGSILPKNMKMANPKYSSRVGAGLVEKISKIDRDLALKIIDNLVEMHHFTLTSDVKELLADCFHYHVYGLESAVLKLKSFSTTFEKTVDVKTALKELKLLGPVLDSQLNSKKIINRVCDLYKVDIEDIFSRNRKKECAFARHLCMYILKERNGLSLSRIATLFNRDHTSVLYGINKILANIQKDESLKKVIHELV
jgi:chromosomal replication initiator protein